MKPRTHASHLILTLGILILAMAGPASAQNYSHGRILRLSYTEGTVTIERPDVQGWAQAPMNTPLEEGFQVSTGAGSFAEIQFESGGTLRLGERALLRLTELKLGADGGTLDHVDLRQGYGTFHPLPSQTEGTLQVDTPYGTLMAHGDTQFRVDLDQGLERVEVFGGSVDVQSNLGSMTIQQDSVLLLQPGTSEPMVVSQGITPDDWDQWVENRDAQTQTPPSGPCQEQYIGGQESMYGMTDLQNYGCWAEVPGEGRGWVPSGVGPEWSPYTAGQWCWYAGYGYTWIGTEPWGWLPYHYGGWDNIPGKGWVWFPGSLQHWSPGQVTWFHGANWTGWVPRSHRIKGSEAVCSGHCGGGAVNNSTFRQGGKLTSNQMLGFSPTSGQVISQPGIAPTTSAMLTGPAHQLPAAQSRIPSGATSRPPAVGNRTAAQSWRTVGQPPGSSIVYDPKEDSFINGHRAANPSNSPVAPTRASGFTTPSSHPQPVQPVPVGSRPMVGETPRNSETAPPSPADSAYTRPGPPVVTGTRERGWPVPASAPTGATRGEASWTQTGNHAGYAPAGASHAGGTPSGNAGRGGHAGGSSGGGHSGGGGGHH